jgi:hypothetical protein
MLTHPPAAALATLVAWGWDRDDALDALRRAHPPGRPFTPNRLMVEALDDLIAVGR